ncbi:mitosis initiation protein fs(1)Ya [Drosophila gunungcola]|uniref:mitosis initiation protein fs(1)Ya n=1 Tax=Drosophila gunungcola TaxID=103775 RepID=UPI0022DED265|nr:mitosis initiation protein fs(1)Ya [Drosophila gunungcola]
MSFSNVLIMRQPDEGKCHFCKRVFCCGKCRQKHQFKAHAIVVREPLGLRASGGGVTEHRQQMESGATTIYVFCPICERRPLLLREEMHGELLAHIEACHLPLRCRKCQRNYTRVDDLREFSKCVDQQQNCTGTGIGSGNDLTGDTETSKVTVRKASNSTAISTQTSPGVTPISLINMRWKAKSRIAHEEFISDSVSSIRNLSSISNSSIRRSIGHLGVNPPETVEKGKIIRSTSTPLQVESVFAKPKEPITFNASNGGHVSSIYQEESSPAVDSNPVQQPLHQRNWKMGARNKMSAATPLRQVMSKSIQKAFVEHGGMLVHQPASGVIQRRVRLDLSEHNSTEAAGSAALDLRLSPVVRRTQSESSSSEVSSSSTQNPDLYQRPFLLSAQKLTTESIVITRMNSNSRESFSTVFNSCESVEIIRSSSESAEVHVPAITPIRVTGGAPINKKQIKFETPTKSCQELVLSGEGDGEGDDTKDQFFTPEPGSPERPERRRQAIVPRQLSDQFSPKKDKSKEQELTQVLALVSPPAQRPRARPPLRECRQKRVFSGVQDVGCGPEEEGEEDEEDEVFRPTNASTRNDKKQEGASSGRLWSLMSSMMRLPASLRSEKDKDQDQDNKENAGSGSLIRRCASIAGSLVRPSAKEYSMEDNQTLKRKRTQTLDNQYCSPLSPSSSSKRYRIRPREPIERMRRH